MVSRNGRVCKRFYGRRCSVPTRCSTGELDKRLHGASWYHILQHVSLHFSQSKKFNHTTYSEAQAVRQRSGSNCHP